MLAGGEVGGIVFCREIEWDERKGDRRVRHQLQVYLNVTFYLHLLAHPEPKILILHSSSTRHTYLLFRRLGKGKGCTERVAKTLSEPSKQYI